MLMATINDETLIYSKTVNTYLTNKAPNFSRIVMTSTFNNGKEQIYPYSQLSSSIVLTIEIFQIYTCHQFINHHLLRMTHFFMKNKEVSGFAMESHKVVSSDLS